MSGPDSRASKSRKLSESGRRESATPGQEAAEYRDEEPHRKLRTALVASLATTSLSVDMRLIHHLDGYDIIRESHDPFITTRGSCDLFKGSHPLYGDVVLKRPRMAVNGDVQSQIRNFRAEAEIWKSLQHPNILRFLGMIQSDGHVWLVSAFAKNGSLPVYLKAHPETERANLIYQFVKAVSYLHQMGIIHGDIKGANILVSADIENKGTVRWCAPELLFQEGAVKSTASDVYALGMTIYEILSDQVPFSDYTDDIKVIQTMSTGKRPPMEPSVSKTGQSYTHLWEVTQRCWDADPSKRPNIGKVETHFGLDDFLDVDVNIPLGQAASSGTNLVPAPDAATLPNLPDDSLAVGDGVQVEDSDLTTIAESVINALTLAKEVVEEIPFPGVKYAVAGLIKLIGILQVPDDNAAALSGDESRWASMIEKTETVARDVDAIIHRAERFVGCGYGHRLSVRKADRSMMEELVKHLDDIIKDLQVFLEVKRTVTTEELMKAKRWKLVNEIPLANARYDDAARKDKFEGCFKGTNEDVLNTINNWIGNPADNVPKIFWLCGAAGMGKTTIAQTVAEQQMEQGRLGASFFFSSTGEANVRGTALFFPTIAHQLAHVDHRILEVIYKSLYSDPRIIHSVTSSQIEPLFVRPLAEWGGAGAGKPLVIVVDALDECSPESDVKAMLGLLASNLRALPSGVRLFVTSRPEWGIGAEFTSKLLSEAHVSIQLHNLPESVISSDIRQYLAHHLPLIAERHGLKGWPSPHQWQSLLGKCGRLFIAAATVVKFLDSPDWSPDERLELYLGDTAASAALDAYGPLDALYAQIVANVVPKGTSSTCADHLRTRFRTVVGCLVFLKEEFTAEQLDLFLGLKSGTVSIALRRLKAALLIPETPTETLRFFHFSFPEFLVNRNRCTDDTFRLDKSREHGTLAFLCLSHIIDKLPPDLMEPEDHGKLKSKVADVSIARLSPPASDVLRYSCIHFAAHFASSSAATNLEIVSTFETLCKTKLLSVLKHLTNLSNTSSTISSLRTMLTVYSAIDRPDDHVKASLLRNLANALFERSPSWSHSADLDNAVKHYGEALELCSLGHPDRYLVIRGLAGTLLKRYQQFKSGDDLNAAIGHYREAIDLRSPGRRDDNTVAYYLAEALVKRYKVDGSVDDLNTSIEFYREALDLSSPDHRHRDTILHNLADALVQRYRRSGSVDELNTAIKFYREALYLCPRGHDDRGTVLNNLAEALVQQHKQGGSLGDLNTGIEFYREALDLCHPSGAFRNTVRYNLAEALVQRYGRGGSVDDLNTAIESYREILNLSPPGHPDHDAVLHNLARALVKRYDRDGVVDDLNTTIELYRGALDICLPGYPDRDAVLHNLAKALVRRHDQDESMDDLNTAIQHYLEALNLCPPSHRNHSTVLRNLSLALLMRSRLECIRAGRII